MIGSDRLRWIAVVLALQACSVDSDNGATALGYSQIEAVTFADDGETFLITSENLPAPLARIALP